MEQVQYVEIGSKLSVFSDPSFKNRALDHIVHTSVNLVTPDSLHDPGLGNRLIYDIISKLLCRGSTPFADFEIERLLVETFGPPWRLHEAAATGRGPIRYTHLPEFTEAVNRFSSFLESWDGIPDDIPVHPEPGKQHNERALLEQLLGVFGNRLPNVLYTQVPLGRILKRDVAAAFTKQRADFLIYLPNGNGIVIEPGDHDPEQQVLDDDRDAAFESLGIPTLRPQNNEIGSDKLSGELYRAVAEAGGLPFLEVQHSGSVQAIALEYLCLLPPLIARIEWVLNEALLRRGLIESESLEIHVTERDLWATEWALLSFFSKLDRLRQLFAIEAPLPETRVAVTRKRAYAYAVPETLHERLAQYGIAFVGEGKEISGVPDLGLDVAVKSNALCRHGNLPGRISCVIRNTYPSNERFRLSYHSEPRPVSVTATTERLLESFLRDVFRKRRFWPGQYAILGSILSQKATIGLLPTGAGKSICYQLASLLTPGTTLVVDPLVALMCDQVQGLKETYGISRVFAWHAGSGVDVSETAWLLSAHVMLFISPERLLRPNFRDAMRALSASDIYVNYAVIDEAHCVSMWGHDFRPSYLSLDRNFKEHCTIHGRVPVIVALTGTASQLVLIDLRRELNIEDIEAIVRPQTFDRPELELNLVRCRSGDKDETLRAVLETIADRLGVPDVFEHAWGIIFVYTLKRLWQTYSAFKDLVESRLDAARESAPIGIYSGSKPKDAPFADSDEWARRKAQTLSGFKRGEIRVLFGNTAVSVGIDNERLNFIVNYSMPQSLEAYYQQCGRAGREGQRSHCFLIFSDDNETATQRWLSDESYKMPRRYDDLGTVAYFHGTNFPGRSEDVGGTLRVLEQILSGVQSDGRTIVRPEPDHVDQCERYISYLLVLGIVVDYEVTGAKSTTRYRIHRHPSVERYLRSRDPQELIEHLISSLHVYMSRYRPYSRDEVERAVNSRREGSHRERLLRCLVDFIYDRIVYQRREAIRTMVDFCNQAEATPGRLRSIVKAYFDGSPKFSPVLNAMSENRPAVASVAQILNSIDGFDDVDHLHWETRRLLDERFRPDWALINLCALLYRERALTDELRSLLIQAVNDLFEDETQGRKDIEGMLLLVLRFLDHASSVDSAYGDSEPASEVLVALYEEYGSRFIALGARISAVPQRREGYALTLAMAQMEAIVNGAGFERVA